MGYLEHLMDTKTPKELAQLAVALAKDNAALRDKVNALEHELFWRVEAVNKRTGA